MRAILPQPYPYRAVQPALRYGDQATRLSVGRMSSLIVTFDGCDLGARKGPHHMTTSHVMWPHSQVAAMDTAPAHTAAPVDTGLHRPFWRAWPANSKKFLSACTFVLSSSPITNAHQTLTGLGWAFADGIGATCAPLRIGGSLYPLVEGVKSYP